MEIQLADLQRDLYNIIESVSRSDRPVTVADNGKPLVKIIPIVSPTKRPWLGCMKGRGKIVGDIISPAEDSAVWEVLAA